ncbi:lipid II:glycine glycyltransferase FemX [Galactobacillus timonensis]|uniref:lipid II:glycine glycyltransferase FemX n=1 Tax=Galactobacillus timonensis TaxID=2041840 RepID=UPI000C85D6FA|nr:peptidoglycan bridge formation glycyltransferase FemA/FemB family protein [Galactobacillus timonensis]
MKFVVDVEPERFDRFAISCPWNHYSKTSPFIELKKPEYSEGHLLGVEDDEGNLIASAVMVFKKTIVPIGRYAYVQYGFNLDIADHELIRYFAQQLRDYAESRGAFDLRMDFNITRIEHNKDGSLKEGGFNHEYVTGILQECGYTHLGYNYGYSGNWMSRYTYRLNLDRPFADVLKGIKRCRIYDTKNKERDVKVRAGRRDELHHLVENEDLLSQQRGFKPKDIHYFEKFWDLYEPYVHYFIVTTNYHRAKLNLMKLMEDNTAKAAKLKDPHKIEDLNKQNTALAKEIRELEEGGYDQDEEKVIGAKFMIMQGVNVWNVNMFTTKTLLNFRAAFALHRYALEKLYNEGAKTYDFEGISGSMDPKDPYYGLNDFKKSFGGDFLEFLGEFDAVINQKKYDTWLKGDRLYRGVRRRMGRIVYKRSESERN